MLRLRHRIKNVGGRPKGRNLSARELDSDKGVTAGLSAFIPKEGIETARPRLIWVRIGTRRQGWVSRSWTLSEETFGGIATTSRAGYRRKSTWSTSVTSVLGLFRVDDFGACVTGVLSIIRCYLLANYHNLVTKGWGTDLLTRKERHDRISLTTSF